MLRSSWFSLVILAAPCLTPVVALADPSPLFGNTMQLQLADGSTVKFYVNADGTYSEVLPSGANITGVWAETSDGMCYTQQTPDVLPQACDPIITHTVGNSWPILGPNGQNEQLSIVAGR